MLHNCLNLEALDISYVARHSPGFFNPVADDFLLCGRWSSLRSLTLTNLWCTPHAGLDAAASFLSAHVGLEILHLDVSFGTGANNHGNGVLASFKFPPNCLPRLRELKASRDFASALLMSPCDAEGGRPLETLKGIRLSNSPRDRVFLENLREFGTQVRRLELAGWNEMEDVRRLAECVPRLVWLDIGKRGGSASNSVIAAISNCGSGSNTKSAPNHVVSNFVRYILVVTLTTAATRSADCSRVDRASGRPSSRRCRSSQHSMASGSSTRSRARTARRLRSRSRTAVVRARTTRSRPCLRGSARSCAGSTTGTTPPGVLSCSSGTRSV